MKVPQILELLQTPSERNTKKTTFIGTEEIQKAERKWYVLLLNKQNKNEQQHYKRKFENTNFSIIL